MTEKSLKSIKNQAQTIIVTFLLHQKYHKTNLLMSWAYMKIITFAYT